MLVKKAMYALSLLDNETVTEMELNCLRNLGQQLFQKEKERLEDPNQDNDREGWLQDTMSRFLNSGTLISFNTNCINFEQTLLLENEFKNIAAFYMVEEFGKLNQDKLDEYTKFIEKLFKSVDIKWLDFKIIQIGNQQYYGYCIN